MSTPTTLAAGAAVTLGLCGIPLAVAAVAAPLNTARDRRRHARQDAEQHGQTETLMGQLYAAAALVGSAGDDPAAIAAAALHAVAALAADGEPGAFLRHAADTLRQILADHDWVTVEPWPTGLSTLTTAAALRLLLDRLTEAHRAPGANRFRAHVAAGAAAEAITRMSFGPILADHQLTEHDPAPVFAANTMWRAMTTSQILES